MWSNFDFGSATKQLSSFAAVAGEAIAKAKQEVETTIEGFEKGEDYVPLPPPPVSSSSPWLETAVHQPPANELHSAAGMQRRSQSRRQML